MRQEDEQRRHGGKGKVMMKRIEEETSMKMKTKMNNDQDTEARCDDNGRERPPMNKNNQRSDDANPTTSRSPTPTQLTYVRYHTQMKNLSTKKKMNAETCAQEILKRL